jgi:hypothetical protein
LTFELTDICRNKFTAGFVGLVRDAKPNPNISFELLGLGCASRSKATQLFLKFFSMKIQTSSIYLSNKKTFMTKYPLQKKLEPLENVLFSE